MAHQGECIPLDYIARVSFKFVGEWLNHPHGSNCNVKSNDVKVTSHDIDNAKLTSDALLNVTLHLFLHKLMAFLDCGLPESHDRRDLAVIIEHQHVQAIHLVVRHAV